MSVNDRAPDPGARDGPWIVITGDPVEGFIFTGPFNNHADAEMWAEGQQDWWTAFLQAPEDTSGLTSVVIPDGRQA